jgi:hypothetical protein
MEGSFLNILFIMRLILLVFRSQYPVIAKLPFRGK